MREPHMRRTVSMTPHTRSSQRRPGDDDSPSTCPMPRPRFPSMLRDHLVMSDDEMDHDLQVMTDWNTDELFACPLDVGITVTFGLSRLMVDPERFIDENETMRREPWGWCLDDFNWTTHPQDA